MSSRLTQLYAGANEKFKGPGAEVSEGGGEFRKELLSKILATLCELALLPLSVRKRILYYLELFTKFRP